MGSPDFNNIKKLNEIYTNKAQQSLTEILKSFSCISNNINQEINQYKYSNIKFDECTPEEQQHFIDDQLQLIECLVTDSIYAKQGSVYNWKYIYDLLYDENYAKTEKKYRKVVYSTSSTLRPVGQTSFQTWNGLQIIDLDIKNNQITNPLKDILFKELSKFHWFLGICRSASKTSLQIWTNITPVTIDKSQRRVEYICNFRHKYSYIYIILLKYAVQFGYTKEDIFKYMDMAMCKPQQGIFISSDNAYLSTNFYDTRLDVNFETAFNTGIESINWISHSDLKDIFAKLEWFTVDDFYESKHISVQQLENLNEYDMKKSKGKKHYKHSQRWQLANTLTSLFGEAKAFEIFCNICSDTSKRELKGDIKTAAIHNKPISKWAVMELNKQHGFNIKIKDDNTDIIDKIAKEIENNDNDKLDPIKILNDKTEHVTLYMTKDQYLSDIQDQIISNLSHITLLEAGAGYGKTEMIKGLKAKTLLILPFTSTIKAKVEADEKTSDWLYFYGNKRPDLIDILGTQNISMTIDKFSRLNVYELDTANFEYIVIDESHLLFTSSYRDVMGPCLQRLANCKAKIIMMTGTPTGEILFFPNIKHIKVKKEDIREKTCDFVLVPTATEQLYEMCDSIAQDILRGRKILFPTNKGNIYYEQILGIIHHILDKKYKSDRPIKSFYYKKAKYGEDAMEDINNNKTIGDYDIIFCTTYLSVGVDICDKYDFGIYFSDPLIPQDIEQYANRLRNNNLHIKMFLPYEDNNGFTIIQDNVKKLDLSFNQQDLIFARDLVKTCNDMLERNEEEAKYNPLISSLLATNKYLKYDENDCKYYIDETTYKLHVFEERYSEFGKQLSIMADGLRYYGYLTHIEKKTDRAVDNKEKIDEILRNCRNFKFNEDTIKIKKFLNQLNDGNIDFYKELQKGNYAVFKDKDEKNVKIREENNLYVEDIEILEKHMPIISSLYKYYDCDTIRTIYEYCIDLKSNRLNVSKLRRIRSFVNIEMSRKKKRLDFPILRFIIDCRKWALDNPVTTKLDIDMFLATWTCKYCNSIKDIIIEDKAYLNYMYEVVQEYWKIVIVQSNPKSKNIHIHPFELLWETKNELTDIYGNQNTKLFFINELMNEQKPLDPNDAEEESLPDFSKESKLKITDIIQDIPNIVHKEFDYFTYSELDESNKRFMRKQENTNPIKDNIFYNAYVHNNQEDKKVDNTDLFKDLPF